MGSEMDGELEPSQVQAKREQRESQSPDKRKSISNKSFRKSKKDLKKEHTELDGDAPLITEDADSQEQTPREPTSPKKRK
eukprot:8568579-Pyramimonas_sp.AAC.1